MPKHGRGEPFVLVIIAGSRSKRLGAALDYQHRADPAV